jgi:stearoyl-CoA desaturase (delta-9 desaturase)
MNKFNGFFYKVWLPLNLVTLLFVFITEVNWYLVFLGWFLLGPIGTGVGSHRLFSHRSFETYPIIEKILAYFSTLSAYAPLLFWVTQHQYHHRYTDTHTDPTSPNEKGFIYSFFTWRLLKENLDKVHLMNFCARRVLKDNTLMWFTNNFTLIIWAHVIILSAIDLSLCLSLYLLPVFFESLRINSLNYVNHLDNVPFNYRNHDIPDHSYNNLIVGWLSFGFGWHNNHHANPGKVMLTEKWWEIDIEGCIAKLISKKI